MYTRNDDDEIIDEAIVIAEDERTAVAKNDIMNVHRFTIDAAHQAIDKTKTKTTLLQRGIHMGQTFSIAAQRLLRSIKRDNKHVQFNRKAKISTFFDKDEATLLTHDSGADGHYLSEQNRKNWDY